VCNPFDRPRRLRATLVVVALALTPAAHARSRSATEPPPLYQEECGACHLAYPPRFLPAASWSRILAGLDAHYGTDASLDESAVSQIGAWLERNAAVSGSRRDMPAEDRITRSGWFARRHRSFAAAAWTHRSIGSASNCGACHTGADRGSFDDDHIRIPGELPASCRTRGSRNSNGEITCGS